MSKFSIIGNENFYDITSNHTFMLCEKRFFLTKETNKSERWPIEILICWRHA